MDPEKILQAIDQADRDGRTDDARDLAAMYKEAVASQQQQQQPQPVPAQQGQPMQMPQQAELVEPQQDESSFWDRAGEAVGAAGEAVGDFAGRAWDGAKSLATGEGRRVEGIPEFDTEESLGLGQIERAKIQFGLLNAVSDKQKRQILRKQLPDAELHQDEYGNDYLVRNGKAAYVNKPGFSIADAGQLAYDAAMFTPFGRGAGLVGKGAQLANATRTVGNVAARGAAAAGAQNLAKQGIANTQGAQNIELAPLAVDSALGLVGTGAGEAVTRKVTDLVGNTGGRGATKNAMNKLGLDSEDGLSESQRLALRVIGSNDMDERTARRYYAGMSQETPMRLTRGQASGDPGQNAIEDNIAKGSSGELWAREMSDRRASQTDALRENADSVLQRLNPNGNYAGDGSGAVDAATRLRQMGASEKAAATGRYDQARELMKDSRATIDPDDRRWLRQQVRRDVRNDVSPDATPRVNSILARTLGTDAQDKAAREAADAGGPKLRGYRINQLIAARRQLSNLSGKNGDEAVAAGTAKRALDRHLDDLIDSGRYNDDNGTVEAWREANKSWRNYKERWGADDVIQRLVDDKTSLDNVGDQIFGTASNGSLTGGKASSDTMRELKNRLGEQSQEWNALRQDALSRLFRASYGPVSGSPNQPTGFSGVKLRTAWERLGRDEKSRRMRDALFSEDDKKMIGDFIETADAMTNQPRGSVNTSNTAIHARQGSAHDMNKALQGITQSIRRRFQFQQAAQTSQSAASTIARGTMMSILFGAMDKARLKAFNGKIARQTDYQVLSPGMNGAGMIGTNTAAPYAPGTAAAILNGDDKERDNQ